MRAAVLLLSLLLAGSASAAWSAHGQEEPDDARDLPWQWRDPPTKTWQIYFQAFPTVAPSESNPNLAAVGSRQAPVGQVRWEAVLGVWVDCNADGHIGLAETAASTYPAPLLLDATRCPPGSPHQRDGIVQELRPIGPGARGAEALDDPDARVWADSGAPGARGHEICRVAPLPRGTTANTGRMMRHADCVTQHVLIGAVNTVDNDGSLGLAIEDPHHPDRSGSHLNQDLPASPYTNPRHGRTGLLDDAGATPTFHAWDCANGNPDVRPANDPTSSSAWSALARAVDATAGDCNPDTGTALDGFRPVVEEPFEPTAHTARDQNDLVLEFSDAPRATPRLSLEPWNQAAITPTPGGHDMRWRSMSDFVTPPPLLSRFNLEPAPARVLTFYASLGPATFGRGLQTPQLNAEGVYGSEACGAQRHGVRAGWACAPDTWWMDLAGDSMPRDLHGRALGARVGEPYHMRDVDCLDGTVVEGVPVWTSIAWLSEAENALCLRPT